MLNKSQFLKKFISNTFLSPYLSSFSLQKSIQLQQLLNFSKISSHPFSSFQSINNYKDDLVLLEGCSREHLAFANEILDRYSTSQDLNAFMPEEIHFIITLLQDFSGTYKTQGNYHKAYSYIKEAEQVLKELKIYDTFDAANNHYFKAGLCLNLDDPTTDLQYHCDEVDRICMILDETPEIRSLRIQNLQTRGIFHSRRYEYGKALEFFNQVIEKKDQAIDEVLPHLLASAYQEMGNIYKLRGEATKAIECYNKGLEIAIPEYGENSTQVFFFYWNSTEVLYQNHRLQEIFPYVHKGLQVALKIFPSNHPQIAWCHYLLANALVANGDRAEAIEECIKAIKIFETSPQEHLFILSKIYFQAAKMYHRMGNTLEAFRFIVESKKLLTMSNDPDIVGICLERGKELTQRGTREEVDLYLIGALGAYKKNPKPQDKEKVAEVNFLLGSLYFENKVWNRALGFMKESEKLFQESSTAPHFLLDSCLATLNALSKNYDQSVKYLLKAIEACKANGYTGYHQQASYYLGKVYHQGGMTEKAKEADEKYRNLCKNNNQEDSDVKNGVQHAQKMFSPIETFDEQKK